MRSGKTIRECRQTWMGGCWGRSVGLSGQKRLSAVDDARNRLPVEYPSEMGHRTGRGKGGGERWNESMKRTVGGRQLQGAWN